MENLVWLIPALGCGLMMVAMMVMMGMGMRMSGDKEKPPREDEPSVEELRAENERLASRVERLEREGAERPR